MLRPLAVSGTGSALKECPELGLLPLSAYSAGIFIFRLDKPYASSDVTGVGGRITEAPQVVPLP